MMQQVAAQKRSWQHGAHAKLRFDGLRGRLSAGGGCRLRRRLRCHGTGGCDGRGGGRRAHLDRLGVGARLRRRLQIRDGLGGRHGAEGRRAVL